MSNSSAAMHPELVREWSDKNLPLTPDKITNGLNNIVWWKAACGHKWQTSVKARSKGENCPIFQGHYRPSRLHLKEQELKIHKTFVERLFGICFCIETDFICGKMVII